MTLKQDRAAKRRAVERLDKACSDSARERDGHKCQRCGSERALGAAHIFGKKAHPATRHDLENLVTLCWPCHRWWAHQEPVEFYAMVLRRLGKRKLEALGRRANGTLKGVGK